MNTTENNKIIAEFMGWDINSPSTFPIQLHQEEETQGNWKLLFHSDWNWLMEVVEKIESLSINEENNSFYFGISSIGATIFSRNRVGFPNQIINTDTNLKGNKIESVYNACVEFIKWYNNQKK